MGFSEEELAALQATAERDRILLLWERACAR